MTNTNWGRMVGAGIGGLIALSIAKPLISGTTKTIDRAFSNKVKRKLKRRRKKRRK